MVAGSTGWRRTTAVKPCSRTPAEVVTGTSAVALNRSLDPSLDVCQAAFQSVAAITPTSLAACP